MTGYDFERQALRLERENADLRRQADRAWLIAMSTAHEAQRHGIVLDAEGLGEHWLETRAAELYHEHVAEALEGFRKTTVTALFDAEDAVVKAGEDPGNILAWVTRTILRANGKAKNVPLEKAREQARHEVAEILGTDTN
ncbi:hypothetical protein [Rhodococcus triatomae]|nr:hypothetical protein G419_25262 [Rhodococcus triatomae BKS 15-14]